MSSEFNVHKPRGLPKCCKLCLHVFCYDGTAFDF